MVKEKVEGEQTLSHPCPSGATTTRQQHSLERTVPLRTRRGGSASFPLLQKLRPQSGVNQRRRQLWAHQATHPTRIKGTRRIGGPSLLHTLYEINGYAGGGCTVLCKHTSVSCRDSLLAAVTQPVEITQTPRFSCQDTHQEKAKPSDIAASKRNIVLHGLEEEEGRCPKGSGKGGGAAG